MTLADGTKTKVNSYKETIQLRCVQAGHYEFGANLYSYHLNGLRQDDAKTLGLKVHAEIAALNPSYHVLFSKDIVLNRVGQTVNLTGFDLTRDGALTLTDAPLQSITEKFLHAGFGGAP